MPMTLAVQALHMPGRDRRSWPCPCHRRPDGAFARQGLRSI